MTSSNVGPAPEQFSFVHQAEAAGTPQSPDDSPDAPAAAPSPKVPARNVPLISRPQEQKGAEPQPSFDGADPGTQSLVRLIALRPFMSYFHWLAHSQNPASHRPETRVKQFREANRVLFWICCALDMLVTLVAVAVLLAVAAIVLYKTISPIG